jgi:hypothetical protein
MAVTGSFDTAAMRSGAQQLTHATDLLRTLGAALRIDGFPSPVDKALDNLGKRGHDMIDDIAKESEELGQRLDDAADCYESLEQSICNRFGSQL